MTLPNIDFQYDNLLGLKDNNKDVRENVTIKLTDLFNNSDDIKECVSLAHTLNQVLDSSETSYERLLRLQQQDIERNDDKEFNRQALMILKSSNGVENEDLNDIQDKLDNNINDIIKDDPIRKEELEMNDE